MCVCACVNAELCLFLSASLLTGDLLSGLVSLQGFVCVCVCVCVHA